jgi:nitronate monooxygenase
VGVLAAGGIADGRGLAAALMLGAQGALIGTRFFASAEALGGDAAKQRIVAAHGADTLRTNVFDIVRGYAWPTGHTGRAIRNRYTDRWHGREGELRGAVDFEREVYQAAARAGDCDTAVVWAGEGADLIRRVESAAELVARIAAEAEARLRDGAALAR